MKRKFLFFAAAGSPIPLSAAVLSFAAAGLLVSLEAGGLTYNPVPPPLVPQPGGRSLPAINCADAATARRFSGYCADLRRKSARLAEITEKRRQDIEAAVRAADKKWQAVIKKAAHDMPDRRIIEECLSWRKQNIDPVPGCSRTGEPCETLRAKTAPPAWCSPTGQPYCSAFLGKPPSGCYNPSVRRVAQKPALLKQADKPAPGNNKLAASGKAAETVKAAEPSAKVDSAVKKIERQRKYLLLSAVASGAVGGYLLKTQCNPTTTAIAHPAGAGDPPAVAASAP